jgi:hypothetical protein
LKGALNTIKLRKLRLRPISQFIGRAKKRQNFCRLCPWTV